MTLLAPARRARIVELVLAGEVAQARELCASFGVVLYMRGADLHGADLRGADLREADLCGSDLRGADLTGADLSGVRLCQASLAEGTLEHATLRGAVLVDADLRAASLRWTDLRDVCLSGPTPEDVQTGLRDGHGVRLNNADLRWSNLIGSDLSGADLSDAALSGALYSVQTAWPADFTVPAGAFCFDEGVQQGLPQRDVHVPGYGVLALRVAPAGVFWMGSADDAEGTRPDELPRHRVRLSRGFQISSTLVTQGLYALVMGHNPSYRMHSDAHPVEYLSWFDAVRFCNALSVRCGLSPAYTIGDGSRPSVSCDFSAAGFRLPTEAEWEYAARAGQDLMYSGSREPDEVSWHDGNSGRRTQPVGLRRPNAWGLYDMSGNVYEWCWDWYGRYAPGDRVDPSGASAGSDRVYRGGSWNSSPAFVRVSNRNRCSPSGSRGNLGLRLVRS